LRQLEVEAASNHPAREVPVTRNRIASRVKHGGRTATLNRSRGRSTLPDSCST
jgi:hypothetical protein